MGSPPSLGSLLPGSVSLVREARQAAELNGHLESHNLSQTAFYSFPSSSPGAAAASGLAGGGAPSAAYIPSREAGSRPSVSS